MLKRFLLNALSSFVGAWLAFILVIVCSIMFVFAMIGNMAINMASSSTDGQVKSRSVLVIDLDGPIEERMRPSEPSIMAVLQGNLSEPSTLDVISQAIREAAVNDDIVAIYLKCGVPQASGATFNAIRTELKNFKKKSEGKKKIIAYADSYTQGSYFVASQADKIYMNPQGELNLQGLMSQNFFLKDFFDKVGIEFQVVKVGTYKSAVEPMILNDMSEPARAQLDTLLNVMWQYMRAGIAEGRKKVTEAGIDSLINKNHISMAKATEAVKAGLIDSLVYERAIDPMFADISGREVKKLNYVKPSVLAAQTPWGADYKSKKQIAVLFASGEIADGNNNEINYEKLVPVITELADDKNVKGLVLRVDSPGGSVFGSDQIGEALDYFQSKGKPLAVSMGGTAASGGYWISAKADRIFADPMTITGSIGIFGLIPNFKGTLDKIGVHVAEVSTNPGANFINPFKPLDAEQLDVMQKMVERGYDQFVSRVAEGRKMPKEKVKCIAEGRVWNAITAKKIGLVDELGLLQAAIDWTAAKAGIKDNFDLAAYPNEEPTVWNMIQMGTTSMKALQEAVNRKNQDVISQWIIEKILARKPIQTRMVDININY
ncbi:MAG: signal peptide peptidase SppA [Muribaculaceae bacterium]|nr:signal peptide peptidase SppA [Muribaculaceae bacterium]